MYFRFGACGPASCACAGESGVGLIVTAQIASLYVVRSLRDPYRLYPTYMVREISRALFGIIAEKGTE